MTARKKTKPKPAAPVKNEAPPVVVPMVDQVRAVFDELRSAYAGGWSLDYAVAMAMGPAACPLKVRGAINGDKVMRAAWLALRDARADTFFEKAAMQAEKLEREDPGKAGDLYMKLAAKTAPKLYGDRAQLEISGPDGGPIESVVKLSAEDAYKAMLGRP